MLTVVVADPATLREVLARQEVTGRAPLHLTHGIMEGKVGVKYSTVQYSTAGR